MKSIKYLLILLVFAFWSCKKENMCDCVKSTGPTNTIYHDVQGFTCVTADDKMDVYLTQGAKYEVKVEAGRNLQPLIKTELDGETLKVYNRNRCNWVRGYKHKINVYITAPYFQYVKNIGVGTIQSVGTITQDSIKVRIENSGDVHLNLNTKSFVGSTHGNGDLYLTGVTDNFGYDYNGTNFLYLSDLTVNSYVYLHSVSIGSAYVKAPNNGIMDVVLDRSGNAYYTGTPKIINLKRNSKGDLIKE